jgi:hypothetical protein
MASARMMEKAAAEYYATMHAAREATGEEREALRAKVAKIGVWLECAAVGDSDRDCEFASGYAPAKRPIRRATRQLVEV